MIGLVFLNIGLRYTVVGEHRTKATAQNTKGENYWYLLQNFFCQKRSSND